MGIHLLPPEFKLVLDVKHGSTTIDVAVSESGDDGGADGNGVFLPAATAMNAGQVTAITRNFWMRWNGITIPKGATIGANTYFSVKAASSGLLSNCRLNVIGNDTPTPVAPVSNPDYFTKVPTATVIAWNAPTFPTGTWVNKNVQAIIQELVDSYAYNNGSIQILVKNNTSGNGSFIRPYQWDGISHAQAPQLHIEASW